MKSTFSTQLPTALRPSTSRSDEQGGTVRYGTTMEHMTARETGTICDMIDDTIDLERRHGTRYQATSRMPMPYIIETEKTPRQSTRKTGRGAGRYQIGRLWRRRSPFRFSRRIPARIPDYRFGVLGGWRGVAFPLTLSNQTVRRAGRRPVFRTVAPPRFPLFRLPYSAAFSTLPCLAASMSWRVRKPIA